MNQCILVTGGAGYVGSVLVRRLLNEEYRVRVVDNLRWGGESLLEVQGHPHFEFVRMDVRDLRDRLEVLKGCTAIAHLASIVGDPACKKEPDLARSVNLDGTRQLYELADQAGCERFIFVSTCSNYGRMNDPDAFLTEEAPLAPLSLYAETKVACEQFLLSQPKSRKCVPVCLRFATAYGVSPRMRFDLTVNEFVKELSLGRELVVYGEKFWRPYCHVADLAYAIDLALKSPIRQVAFEVFNAGDTQENYTKQMLVEEIGKHLPQIHVRYVQKDFDPRDYRVNFEKIKNGLGFSVSKRVPQGIAEIIKILQTGFWSNPDDSKYLNS